MHAHRADIIAGATVIAIVGGITLFGLSLRGIHHPPSGTDIPQVISNDGRPPVPLTTDPSQRVQSNVTNQAMPFLVIAAAALIVCTAYFLQRTRSRRLLLASITAGILYLCLYYAAVRFFGGAVVFHMQCIDWCERAAPDFIEYIVNTGAILAALAVLGSASLLVIKSRQRSSVEQPAEQPAK